MTKSADFSPKVDLDGLKKAFIGKKINDLPTPSFIVDRKIVSENCLQMEKRAEEIGAEFRPHVKTHKTIEGTRYQINDGKFTKKVVVSTLQEAWSLMPLYQNGMIDDVLYGIPPAKSRIPELIELKKAVKYVRLMIDNKDQLSLISQVSSDEKWSVFIKVDMGGHRAGLLNGSDELNELVQLVMKLPNFELHGFYCHAGHSYASANADDALQYLYDEINAANTAAELAQEIDPELKPVIAVGSTPTTHAAGVLDKSKIGNLRGPLELHAGNYAFCDLQQMATNYVAENNVACTVLAEVVSRYSNRGELSPGEVLINAGVIALGREPGPITGFGKVKGYNDCWSVGRLSQEHGILVPVGGDAEFPHLGDKVQIIPQHSCITANSYSWYFITDGNDIIVDIWIPWREW